MSDSLIKSMLPQMYRRQNATCRAAIREVEALKQEISKVGRRRSHVEASENEATVGVLTENDIDSLAKNGSESANEAVGTSLPYALEATPECIRNDSELSAMASVQHSRLELTPPSFLLPDQRLKRQNAMAHLPIVHCASRPLRRQRAFSRLPNTNLSGYNGSIESFVDESAHDSDDEVSSSASHDARSQESPRMENSASPEPELIPVLHNVAKATQASSKTDKGEVSSKKDFSGRCRYVSILNCFYRDEPNATRQGSAEVCLPLSSFYYRWDPLRLSWAARTTSETATSTTTA